MNAETITIRYKSEYMLLSKDFASLIGIAHGYVIETESEFWGILEAHCKHQIAKMKLLVSANENPQ